MKAKESILEQGKRIWARLSRYKFVLLVVALGVILLSWPENTENSDESEGALFAEEGFSVEALEKKLATTLSLVDGAGNVQIVLTVQSSEERVFAQDGSTEQENGTSSKKIETVIVASGSGKQETVLVQRIYPQFQGALIIADGGADPNVRLKLTQAVAALTGLGSDKISICKRK